MPDYKKAGGNEGRSHHDGPTPSRSNGKDSAMEGRQSAEPRLRAATVTRSTSNLMSASDNRLA
jgi:hypothetical protein